MNSWDYLIVTASNEVQAQGYRSQLDLRKKLGLLEGVRDVLVVPDPDGRRVGSGGSTLYCLLKILEIELSGKPDIAESTAWVNVLHHRRILIIHAGGDSRRLPAYGPCGKIFVPVPGESDSCLPMTLFDRQLPVYLSLPPMPDGVGQVVVTAGDVLLQFNPSEVHFNPNGITGLGCHASPEDACKHGVYIGGHLGDVKKFLQKPSPETQHTTGAVDKYGQSALDIGVVNFDAATAAKLLDIFGVRYDGKSGFKFSGEIGAAVSSLELDFYREICCAMGTEVSFEDYSASVVQSGSKWENSKLKSLFEASRDISFYFQTLSHCDFLHFGTSRQIISSGISVIARDRGVVPPLGNVEVNNTVLCKSEITGSNYWIEGCTVKDNLHFAGNNVLTGVEVDSPMNLPEGMCLDLLPGADRSGNKVWFVRAYGVLDTFKEESEDDAYYCNKLFKDWAKGVNAGKEDLWPGVQDTLEMTVFNAKLFVAVSNKGDYKKWLWMFDPFEANDAEISAWHNAERYSLAEMAYFSDNEKFFHLRYSIRADEIKSSLQKVFRLSSEFSADDLAMILANSDDVGDWIADILQEISRSSDVRAGRGIESFISARILHTLASSLMQICPNSSEEFVNAFAGVADNLDSRTVEYLKSAGLEIHEGVSVGSWCEKACKEVFRSLGAAILSGDNKKLTLPKNSLRKDEIVWGRAPARMDTGGGWTDTPPYSLEYGGSVVNVAVDLNGQPPIHVYARVIEEPVVRISSIDIGDRTEISELEQLLDYNKADSSFGLAKAAIALCGFSHETSMQHGSVSLRDMLLNFGGGLELTTLAAIPKGSGLGTSSIVGSVLIAVLKRLMGQTLTQRQLFNSVLQLEQILTTGGGWQDQIGGSVPGAKINSAGPGLIPDTRIHYLPADVIDPVCNCGQTLLYYTGITRLAKNILEKVVGGYLDRRRSTMATLRQIHASAETAAEAMSLKDIELYGRTIDYIWKLNVQLDPNSTNAAVEELYSRVKPYTYGAKLLGAGGGGFMLMVAKSVDDAAEIRQMLENEPPNEKSRFFDYSINTDGLVVTVC